MEISLTIVQTAPNEPFTIYTNRVVGMPDNYQYERGCSTLTVFMEPY